MTEKRYGFEMDKNCYNCIVDNIDKKLYTDKKQIVDLLNELDSENKQLHGIIIENEKMIQSIYDELLKLRHIKENLRTIKNYWGWIMEAIEYD